MIADFAIVGAGMAGASLAAELAPYANVLLLEAEDRPGYHATGRSAAFWEETYGGPQIAPLTRASGKFLRDQGFLRSRGALYIGQADDRVALDAYAKKFARSDLKLSRLDRTELIVKLPGLRPNWIDGVWQPACADIDVTGLHAFYLTTARRHGTRLVSHARISRVYRRSTHWELQADNGQTFLAETLVNAAGAWADQVAQMAGIAPLGIEPYRRTVAQLRTSPAPDDDMPLVLDISGTFYFKPDNGKIWLSPHDEVPSVPCDSAPEELAVARAVARFEGVMDLNVDQVETKWAGLRSFAPDRLPVYGADTADPKFVWFAGQGGFGIQTAPAAASLLAGQLLGQAGTIDVSPINPMKFFPKRFNMTATE